MAVKASDPAQEAMSAQIYQELKKAGVDVLWDDRDERHGFKIKDSDLIGIPYKLIIGPKNLETGHIEIEARNGEKNLIALTEVLNWAQKHLKRG
jgi:prolyl-tRNA synthetase